jgi:hypothetical protein
MTGYRRLWWVTTLVTGVPSAFVGLTFSPTPGVVAAVTVLGLAAGARLVPGTQGVRWWRDLSSAIVLALAAGPALRGATLPLLMLAGASAPSVVAAVRRTQLATEPPPEGTTPVPESNAPPDVVDEELCLGALDGRVLCELWRSSFVRLKLASTAEERVVVAALRARLLDEMERRNGHGFAAWLARCPSPASQPGWMAAPSPEHDVRDE